MPFVVYWNKARPRIRIHRDSCKIYVKRKRGPHVIGQGGWSEPLTYWEAREHAAKLKADKSLPEPIDCPRCHPEQQAATEAGFEDSEEVQRVFELAVSRAASDSQADRLTRLAVANKKPKQRRVLAVVFDRNPDVVAEVLSRALGKCERCRREAPFSRAKDGSPYLEVHHTVRLVDGGEDSIENALALCPNCHRELHYGMIRD